MGKGTRKEGNVDAEEAPQCPGVHAKPVTNEQYSAGPWNHPWTEKTPDNNKCALSRTPDFLLGHPGTVAEDGSLQPAPGLCKFLPPSAAHCIPGSETWLGLGVHPPLYSHVLR